MRIIGAISDLGWADYGLAGVMVGGLLVLVFWLIRQQREERKENGDAHRQERTEWREANERQTEKLDRTMQSLEQAIRDRHQGRSD